MQREEMDILEQQARLWAFNKHFAMRDVEIAKAAFLAGHASRDEEVLRLQSEKESLISMLMELTHDIKHYIPSYPEMWNVAAAVEKAEQLLSKYSNPKP